MPGSSSCLATEAEPGAVDETGSTRGGERRPVDEPGDGEEVVGELVDRVAPHRDRIGAGVRSWAARVREVGEAVCEVPDRSLDGDDRVGAGGESLVPGRSTADGRPSLDQHPLDVGQVVEGVPGAGRRLDGWVCGVESREPGPELRADDAKRRSDVLDGERTPDESASVASIHGVEANRAGRQAREPFRTTLVRSMDNGVLLATGARREGRTGRWTVGIDDCRSSLETARPRPVPTPCPPAG